MKQSLRIIQLSLLLIAFSAKAFVPTGMMLDVQSFVRGGDLVTICPSVGELPWMTAYIDHSGHEMAGIDENANERCPYAALDAPANIPTIDKPPVYAALQYAIIRAYTDQYRNIILRRTARAPPLV
ncbi:hypothetical protein [Kordiimonas aquimaris]|uniref:hypothetical protein n=1 Tax=Kordiimonas aquimaris TaxID=707591 RepID=UPI0021D03684|nr:hypothetical protein [Kordiimonas aquimaris]